MKKTIIRSTILLIIVSVIAKILSFIVRIMLARTLSEQAMNYYTLASPTMVFVITLAQMGIPTALSKVIAQSKTPNKSMKVSILLSVLNNVVIILSFLIILPMLAQYVLKQNEIKPVLYAILPLIPFVTISGLLKGYLYGIQQHIQATSSQIFEELARIIFLFVVFSLHPDMSAIQMAQYAMISVTVGEVISMLFMLCSIRIKKHTLSRIPHLFLDLNRSSFYEILSVSLPMTGSRLIGSLTYFFEPIIMVMGLSSIAAGSMISAYGQLNGYVLPIITMPSFITVTLSNFLLPSFTYHYSRGDIKNAKKLFNVIISCCFFIGICCSFACYFYNEELLTLFYHNTRGAHILKQLAWPFALFSLQAPLSSMLHALSRSKKTVLDTLLGSVARLSCVFFLTPLLGNTSLFIGLVLGMLLTTITHALRLGVALHQDVKKTASSPIPF
ncbi:oligosaccharide flippase family protein [Amedibacillus sp. YH-ame6]